MKALVAQSGPTLCNPVDYSPPGSSVHGILQARIQEWVAIPFSRGSSQPRDGARLLDCRQILHHLSHQESPRGDCIPHQHDRRFMGAVMSQVWVQSPALAVWPQGSHPISVNLGAASVEWRSREPLVPRTAIRLPEWRPLGWMPPLWAEVLALGPQPLPAPKEQSQVPWAEWGQILY